MECSSLLETALKKGNINLSLFQGSSKKVLITDLHRVLYELGFKQELNWDDYQADGVYGETTVVAVKAFAAKNNIKSDGIFVSDELAKTILQRHDFLPDMYVLWSIHNSDLRRTKYISRGTKMSIIAIQTLLNELGYSKQLKFAEYGADGLYGTSTRNAVIAFAKDNNIETDGDILTRPLVNLLLKHVNHYYGKDWSELAKNNLPADDSPLVLFEGSRFMGKPCRADIEFVPMLEKINAYAEQANVHIVVTSSFRTTTNVKGAIVKPATYSNHLAGHGIDMNIRYDNRLANSKILAQYPDVPAPVRQFLHNVINDSELRWGGQFRHKDPVHIDDGLNRDRRKWEERYEVMQRAVQLGSVLV